MFTFEQCSEELQNIQKLLDKFHDLNDNKTVSKNNELKEYSNGLRKSCIALGNLRYKLIPR